MSKKVTIEEKKQIRQVLKFLEFHRKKPEVYNYFKTFMFEMIENKGVKISGRLCYERVRWEMIIKKEADEKYKMNNNFVPAYIRLFCAEYPIYRDMIEKRKSVFDEYEFEKLVK